MLARKPGQHQLSHRRHQSAADSLQNAEPDQGAR
jgi:hypothetical protein